MATELELLAQIVHNTSGKDLPLEIALVSAGAALLGATIGAVVSYLGLRNARNIETKKLKAELIARERLRWLQDLRQRLSTFYSDLDMQYNLLKRPVDPKDVASFQTLLDSFSKTVSEQCNLLILMLNPRKPKQEKLRIALNDAQGFFLKAIGQKQLAAAAFDDRLYAAIKTSAFDAATEIGIETWKQVKELE
jgi:hypothetical protein